MLATALCATAVCPFEAVRIISVRTGASSIDALRQQVSEDGVASLYRGLGPILLKEVPFVVTKFVVFDRVQQFIIDAAPPTVIDGLAISVGFPLLAGSIAGVCAAIASQPADVLLTLTNEGNATLGSAVTRLTTSPTLALKGVGPRALFGALLTSLQFLLYSNLRGLLGVSKSDLTLVWDALAVLKGGAG